MLRLVTEPGADQVFCGRPERQVGPEDFYNSGGEALPVTDLTSALLALRVVTETRTQILTKRGAGTSPAPRSRSTTTRSSAATRSPQRGHTSRLTSAEVLIRSAHG